MTNLSPENPKLFKPAKKGLILNSFNEQSVIAIYKLGSISSFLDVAYRLYARELIKFQKESFFSSCVIAEQTLVEVVQLYEICTIFDDIPSIYKIDDFLKFDLGTFVCGGFSDKKNQLTNAVSLIQKINKIRRAILENFEAFSSLEGRVIEKCCYDVDKDQFTIEIESGAVISARRLISYSK